MVTEAEVGLEIESATVMLLPIVTVPKFRFPLATLTTAAGVVV